jgi:hypothetical protein
MSIASEIFKVEVSLDLDKKETIIQKCDRLREEGTKYLDNFEKDKKEQERFYKGEHFSNGEPTNRPKNHVFQIVESEIPLLMDPMPTTDVVAHDSSRFADHALVMDAAKKHVYTQQNVTIKDSQAFRSMLKTGSGYQYIDFDPDGERGEGSITVKNLNRKQVIKDPAADTIDECRYVIIDSALSNDDLKRRFPKTAKEALSQPLKDIFLFAGKGKRESQNLDHGGGKEINRYDSKDMTFIEEYWLKDYTLEEIPDEETQLQLTEESAELMQGINPDTSKWEHHESHVEGHREQKIIIISEALQIPSEVVTEQDIENAKQDPEIALRLNIIDDHIEMHLAYIDSLDPEEVGKRPKYPNNLRLVIKTGKTVHFDGAPEVDDGMVPLVEFECYKDDGPAEGAIKHIIPMQKTLNELDAKELRGLKKHTSSIWVVDAQAEIDDDTLTDEDDLVVTKEQGSEATRLPPGQVSPQLENRSRREYEAMQRIEGTGEVVFGEAPKGDPSGVMYKRMQQQALGRIRLKSTMIGAAILRRDQLIGTRIMKYWSTERKLRVEDADGQIRFIKFDPKVMRDFSYEFVLSPGSTAGMDNETIQAVYKDMLDKGQIDLKTYVTLTKLPKKHELLRLLQENDQAAAQAQELQAQNQQLQQQLLVMKAKLAPNLLTPEEAKSYEQIVMQEQQAALVDPMTEVGNQAAG